MLIGIRFYAKKGLNNLWNAIEKDIRNFYSPQITPLFVVQEEGKEFLGIIFDIKDLDEFENFLTSNPTIRKTTRKTRSVPFPIPYYFDLPEGHSNDMQRFNVFLRIIPEYYKTVYETIPLLKLPKDVILLFSCFSFGDDDMILSFFAKDINQMRKFKKSSIDTVIGVGSSSISKVVRSKLLTSQQNWNNHREMLRYTNRNVSPARRKYENEQLTMTVIIKMYSDNNLSELWDSIEKNITTFESKDFVPLYASMQESTDYISLVANIRNFEKIYQLFSTGLPDTIKVRKWRTFPLLKPVYFLIPKDIPEPLERYLISMRVEPASYRNVYQKLVSMDYPKNVFLSYISYSMGYYDILVSLLAQSREDLENFAEHCIENVHGIISYDTSSQLKTLRLTSKKVWLAHRNKHLSSYDRTHRTELNLGYDWMGWVDYLEEQGGPFLKNLYEVD